MALFNLLRDSVVTGAHAVATGAIMAANAATNGQHPELRQAQQEQAQRMQQAARSVEFNASIVGADANRVVGAIGPCTVVAGDILRDPAQQKRLVELIQRNDFQGMLRALTRRERLEPNFFPSWIRRAGGYFPKFAQVLSVRADLIRDPEVLRQLGTCLEDMPARPIVEVEQLLRSAEVGFPDEVCQGVGDVINAGSVAQVNHLVIPSPGQDGVQVAVVKVAWPGIKVQMQTDFRLFSHAKAILSALRLEDLQTQTICSMFAAVGKSEAAVMREFDLTLEARALRVAGDLAGAAGEWPQVHTEWLSEVELRVRANLPQELHVPAALMMEQQRSRGMHVRVPQPLPGLSKESALVMELAGGESVHRLLRGDLGDAPQQEAMLALLTIAVPFIGWLLLCKSTQALAHVDPHPGNFRWDSATRTLWVLDWGSHVTLSEEKRRALCIVVTLLASGADDGPIADAARALGLQGGRDKQLATVIAGIFTVSRDASAMDALTAAAVDELLENVEDEIVPVVRCLATLGGMLKESKRRLREMAQRDLPLSLAMLWAPLAQKGLQI